MELLLGFMIGITIGILILLIVRKSLSSSLVSKQIEQSLHEAFPKLLLHANRQLIEMADQKLTAEKQEIKTDLHNKKNQIEDIVKRLHEEVDKNNKKLEEAEKDRIGSFTQLKTELENQRKITEQLSVTADGLKKVLSHNQLRGQFGEQVAEDLLRMCGFVHGIDYFYNKTLEDGISRPDFTVLLPDGMKINIDVKFPFTNLQKMLEADDTSAKDEYKKAFERDIKEKIKQVTSRAYVNPKDSTVDFAILFVPNEMIFSFVYEHMNEIWADGMKQKIIFAGPFNFTAVLRLIRQSYSNFTIQRDIQKIISYIKVFEEEFSKYNEEFEKIGERIISLSDQYEKVDTTRTKKLIGSIEKIKTEQNEVLPSGAVIHQTLPS